MNELARWSNADKDMLVCLSCRQALAIALHSSLSAKSTGALCDAYRQQLATTHKQDCPFRLDAQQFLRLEEEGKDSKTKVVVPAYMVSVLPEDCVEIMEHPAPIEVLKSRVKKLENVWEAGEARWKYPKLEISQEIRDYRLNNDDTADGLTLINNLSDLLGTKDESVLTLAILGWIPIDHTTETSTSSVPVVTLGCPICLSLMELRLEQATSNLHPRENEDDSGDPPNKKQRKLAMFCNPYDAHRHYCPYKCGFPKAVSTHELAVWKVILSRLHDDNKDKGPPENLAEEAATGWDESYEKIRTILRSGIAPKRVDLTGYLSEDG